MVSSQYGERIMFSLADGRVMFLDPKISGQIESLGINVRENFTITRKWDGQNTTLHCILGSRANSRGAAPTARSSFPQYQRAPSNPTEGTESQQDAALSSPPWSMRPTPFVDSAYSQVLERTLGASIKGASSPRRPRSLLVTAYIHARRSFPQMLLSPTRRGSGRARSIGTASAPSLLQPWL